MKKVFGLVAAAALMFGGAVFAEGYISANDLTKGDITDVVNEEDGFVLIGSPEKPMAIDKADNVDSTDGDIFTQRISLKGTGKTTVRCVSFPAKKGETITVYGNSSSATDARVLNVKNEAGELVTTIPVDNYKTGKATVESFKAPETDTYYIMSANSGCYIYQIKVEK